ncbi:hypothetical protein GQX73_g7619 [Xylaria multiplex]|uniref:Uncharacterized protein n=1 Tax=Xylaria multiplex TaxID=323545 RepID=A0A7C8MJ31_9PEZI|nr:hypothetical protein GQX73_g7619 [Xylaria multiplex]
MGIFYCVSIGDLEGTKKFADSGIQLNQKFTNGFTPLAYAIFLGQFEIFNFLINHESVDINILDSLGKSPLYLALENGKDKMVHELLRRLSKEGVSQKANDGSTPLHAAVKRRDGETLIALIESLKKHDQSLDLADSNENTPLYSAVEAAYPEAVRELCKAGSDANGIHEWKRPLFAAVRQGDEDIIKILLDNRASPKILDENGLSPIYWVFKTGKPQLLIPFLGIIDVPQPIQDPLLTLQTLKTEQLEALGLAGPSKNQDPLMALLKAVEMSESNIQAEPPVTDSDGWTALHLAARNGYAKAIKALLHTTGEINVPDNDKWTPLHLAAKNGHEEAVKELLDAGGDINHEADLEIRDDIYEQSALSYATEGGYEEIVSLLIWAGADINSQHMGKYPPLERAIWADNPEILRPFFNTEKSSNPPGEMLPRVMVIEEAMYLACNRGRQKTIDWILADKDYLIAADEKGRTVLSLAAINGHEDVVRALLENGERGYCDIATLLLDNGADADSEDNKKRTPLSWAATSANEVTAWALHKKGVKLDSRDSTGRTPLSWAAGSGSEAIVKALLQMESPEISYTSRKDSSRRTIMEIKDKDKHWTPLWYAALGGHINTTKALLEHGADATAKDVQDEDLIDHLTQTETTGPPGPTGSLVSQREIRKLLEPYFSLLSECLGDSETVDSMFSAMSVWFPESQGKELEPERISVSDLLSEGMRWVEILMARHYMDSGDQDGRRRNQVLKSKLWTDNQYIPRDRTLYHGRFMLPGCHMLPPTINPESGLTLKKETKGIGPEIVNPFDNRTSGPGEKGSKSGQSKTKAGLKDTELRQKGLVLFMPYLHWELETELEKLKNIMKEKRDAELKKRRQLSKDKHDLQNIQEDSRRNAAEKFAAEAPHASGESLNDSEKLFWMYLDEEHPVHIRRTLDQYYYPDSWKLEERDKDQTTLRYFNDRRDTYDKAFKPVLTMVDQLWMWVLPKCGSSPPTIITAFPQRSNRGSDTKWRTALMNSILMKCGELSTPSCYEVADIIAAECSRIYFDPTRDRQELLRFLEIYRSSIAKIMDSDASRFSIFETSIGKIRRAIGLVKLDISESRGHLKKQEPPKEVQGKSTEAKPTEADSLDIRNLLKSLLDIEEDIEDLRQVKDIRDELNMMTSVFHIQEEVMKEMYQNIQEEKARVKPQDTSRKQPDQSTSLNYLKTVVKKNLKEVERLDQFAGRAAAAIEQLLELKQKQADLLLTNATYNINDATDKQGKTLMMFTVVTIIFLPGSFMASFLALNVAQFPWGEDKLPLRWVVKVILSVSLPLSTVFLSVAFNLDKSQRHKHFGWFTKRLPEVQSICPPKLAFRRNKKEKHVEEGTSRD